VDVVHTAIIALSTTVAISAAFLIMMYEMED